MVGKLNRSHPTPQMFNPFVMGAILLMKIFTPFVISTTAFSAIISLTAKKPRFGMYLVVGRGCIEHKY